MKSTIISYCIVVVVPGNGVMVVCGSFNDGVEVLFCGQEEPMAEVAGGMLVAWMRDVSERLWWRKITVGVCDWNAMS